MAKKKIELISFDRSLENYKFSKAYRALFEKKGFYTVGDLLSFPPKQILFFENSIDPEEYLLTYVSLVLKVREIVAPQNRNFIFLIARDYQGNLYRILSYQKTKWKNILTSILSKKSEVTILVYGLLRQDTSLFSQPPCQYFIEARYLDLFAKKRIATPLYFSDNAVNEKLQKSVETVLDGACFPDALAPFMPKGFPDLTTALRWLHKPDDRDQWQTAINRYLIAALVYFFIRRDQSIPLLTSYETPPRALNCQFSEEGTTNLPFELTDSQKAAISATLEKMSQEKSTVHYIIGDVGSGKSVVAYQSAVSVMTAEVGDGSSPPRVVLLAPTVLLATQHYQDFVTYYPELADKVKLVTGTSRVKGLDQYQMLIGTHALLSHGDLPVDLLIVDEPQKWGISQQKWKTPTHYLFLTATPLPRWTALLLSNSIPYSEIEPRPREVTLVPLQFSEEKFRYLMQKLPQNKPKMIVVPKISSEGAYMNLEQVRSILIDMKIPTAIIHGRMRKEDVLDEMERFRRGEVNTLLATQMVETGLNILDLKYLIVIGAESFGNLNLYQLTGRVGRNGEQAFAYLMTCNLHRMKEYTEQVTSGYEAAKLDLVQRGAGSMDEAEQSGIVKIAKGEFITPEIIQIAADVYKNLNKNPAEKERASAELSAFFDRVF